MPRYVVIKYVSVQFDGTVEAETPEGAARASYSLFGQTSDLEVNSHEVDLVQVFLVDENGDILEGANPVLEG